MNSSSFKNVLRIIFGLIPLFMIYLVAVTSMKSNMFHLQADVLNEPWFRTTLIDFYFNIFIISIWVVYRERSILLSIVWIISFICLGSIATAFYIFMQLMSLKDNEGLEKVLLRKSSR